MAASLPGSACTVLMTTGAVAALTTLASGLATAVDPTTAVTNDG